MSSEILLLQVAVVFKVLSEAHSVKSTDDNCKMSCSKQMTLGNQDSMGVGTRSSWDHVQIRVGLALCGHADVLFRPPANPPLFLHVCLVAPCDVVLCTQITSSAGTVTKATAGNLDLTVQKYSSICSMTVVPYVEEIPPTSSPSSWLCKMPEPAKASDIVLRYVRGKLTHC